MTPERSTSQTLSACCAFLIAFIGLVHEAVGPKLFPWAPDFFGVVLWHGIGVLAIALGLLLLGGTMGLMVVPVTPLAIFAAIGGLAAVLFIAMHAGEFHFFALSLSIAAVGVAVLHRRA
jgi:hypothetical protein